MLEDEALNRYEGVSSFGEIVTREDETTMDDLLQENAQLRKELKTVRQGVIAELKEVLDKAQYSYRLSAIENWIEQNSEEQS